MKKNLMIFMKDGRIKKVSEKKLPSLSSIEFILVPIIGFDSIGYLYVEPTEFLNFKSASIDFQFKLNYYSDGCREYTVELEPSKVQTSSITELYNLLYSFNRYQRVTSFENVFVSDDIPSDILVEPKYFNLELYDNDDEMMYGTYMNEFLDSATKYNMIDKMFDVLFGELDRDLFGARRQKFIIIRNNEWDIKSINKLRETDLVGIGSIYTKGIIFIEASELISLKEAIKDVSVQINIIDFNQYHIHINVSEPLELLDDIGRGIFPVKSTEYWLHSMDDIILFMDSLKAYTELSNAFMHAIYKVYFEKMYKSMDLKPLVIVNTDFLSMKLRSNTKAYLRENIIGLDDFIKEVISCKKLL